MDEERNPCTARDHLSNECKQRIQCEKDALRTKILLIYGHLSEATFKDIINLIDRSHYNEVTEERSLNHCCGYPLCEKLLPNLTEKERRQKYRISMKANKVYDITERQRFCSDFCYKCSKFIEMQISCTPVWCRQQNPVQNYTLYYDDAMKGIPGKEIISKRLLIGESEGNELRRGAAHAPVRNSDENVSNMRNNLRETRTSQAIESISTEPDESNAATENAIEICASNNHSKETRNDAVTDRKVRHARSAINRPRVPLREEDVSSLPVDSESKLEECVGTDIVRSHDVDKPKKQDYEYNINKVFNCVFSWITKTTKKYIEGENISNLFTKSSEAMWKSREMELFEERVKHFFSQRCGNSKESNQDELVPVVSPVQEANAIRFSFFMKKIVKSLNEIVKFGQHTDEELILKDLQSLVRTFRLSNKNVILRPMEWTIASIILLRLLFLRNKTLYNTVFDSNRLTLQLLNILKLRIEQIDLELFMALFLAQDDVCE